MVVNAVVLVVLVGATDDVGGAAPETMDVELLVDVVAVPKVTEEEEDVLGSA